MKHYWNITGTLLEHYWNITGTLLEHYWNITETLLEQLLEQLDKFIPVHFICPMSVRYSTNWDRKG